MYIQETSISKANTSCLYGLNPFPYFIYSVLQYVAVFCYCIQLWQLTVTVADEVCYVRIH